jgi:hypothetical protein
MIIAYFILKAGIEGLENGRWWREFEVEVDGLVFV